jgi:hypothetical protein
MSIEIRGWDCPRCRVFNGEEKEHLARCRACDYPRDLLCSLREKGNFVDLMDEAADEIERLLAREVCGWRFTRVCDGQEVSCGLPVFHDSAHAEGGRP